MKHTPNFPAMSERDELLCVASDVGKDLFGFRPRWIAQMDNAELRETITRWNQQIAEDCEHERQEQRAHEKAVLVATTRKEWTIADFFASWQFPV